MDRSLHTIPDFYMKDPSPKVQDSAFPPFKVEHRYRGVYERAGFDVNLRNCESPREDSRSIFSNRTHDSRRHLPRYPTPPKSSTESLKSPTLSPNRGNFEPPKTAIGYEGSQGSFSENLKNGYPKKSNQLRTFSESTDKLPMNKSMAVPYQRSHSESSPAINSHRFNAPEPTYIPSIDEKLNSQNVSGFNKNHKNLQLNLKHGSGELSRDTDSDGDSFTNKNDDTNDTEDTSISADKMASPVSTKPESLSNVPMTVVTPPEEAGKPPTRQFDPRGRQGSTGSKGSQGSKSSQRHVPESFNSKAIPQRISPTNSKYSSSLHSTTGSGIGVNTEPQFIQQENTTANGSDVPSSVLVQKNEIINSALDEFKRDVEDHKVYSPKSRTTKELKPGKPQLPSVSPSELGLGKSKFDDGYDREFEQHLLNAKSENDNRFSQLSTVSSIISRDSVSDDEDAEEERLLQKQLDSLKAGSSESMLHGSVSNGNAIQENFDQHGNKDGIQSHVHNVPTFKIEETDAVDKMDTKSDRHEGHSKSQINDTNVDKGGMSEDDEDYSSGVVYEEVKPLSVRHSRVKSRDEDIPEDESHIVPRKRSVKFKQTLVRDSASMRSVHFNDTTENPLSPVNSFKSVFDDDAVKPLSPKNHMVEEELRNLNFGVEGVSKNTVNSPLSQNEAVSTTGFQDEIDQKYGPGEGPCRECHNPISPVARGNQKAIFSKDGELSGQWHRSCFKCGDHSCDVVFNKRVQCYVLDDTPYCKMHYHNLNNTVCHDCSTGIEGDCIENELEQKWHLSCLTCTKCDRPISNDYYLINGLIYCDADVQSIMNGNGSFSDANGNLRTGGLSTNDKIEKRRTRLLYLD